MKSVHSPVRFITPVVFAFLFTASFAFLLISAEKTYPLKTGAETEILSLVLKAEFQANGWTKNELICFSVDGKDPSSSLVKTLRQRDLNVCSMAEWRKKLACGFEANLQFRTVESSQNARVHAEVADFREINEGVAHVAVRQRDGEYLLQKIDGKWSISEYVPAK
jgi:hypothetical protein